MTSEYAPRLSRRTTLSSIQELDADRVPEGTVASRVLRLQHLAARDPDAALLPLPERDRDGESSGWGRRVEGEVRLVQPASHVNSIELGDRVPRRLVSSYLRRSSNLLAIPETNSDPAVHHRPSASAGQRLSRMASDLSAESPPSTSSSRLEDARQILQEHKISLPLG